jgi:hypothetical protein
MDQLLRNVRGKDCAIFVAVLVVVVLTSSCQQQINYPSPVVSSLSPNNVNAGSPAFTLTVVGSHLTPASYVTWNGAPRVSFFQDEGHITANILQSDVVNPELAQVTVTTPAPGGGTFQPPVDFTVNPIAVPVPSISSLSPAGVYANSSGFELRVFGNNFVATSVVTVNGANRTSQEVNSTELAVAVNASDVVDAIPLQIAVINPPVPNPPAGVAPGGGSSNIVLLGVTDPVPVISAISPKEVGVNSSSASQNLTVSGVGFVRSSVVLINGAARTTTFANGGSLTATLTAGDVTLSGVDQITVISPGPGGGTSNGLPFAVNPTLAAGLPELLDYAYDGTVSNSGVCGTNCATATPTLATAGPVLSQDGATVAFASISSNLIFNQATSGSQIFTRTTCVGNNSCTPTTGLVSVGPNSIAPNGASSEPSMDSSAAHVIFTSTATDLTNYVTPPASVRQVYWEAPCATASGTGTGSSCTGAVLVSLGADGNPGNADSYNAATSPDGEFVAFVSLATNLVSGISVNGSTPQVYVRTMCSGVTPVTQTSASCTPTTYLVSSADGVTPGNAPSAHPSVSAGGGYVAFASSATNLGAAAPNPNAQQEVFVQQVCEITSTGCTTPFTSLGSTPDGQTPADAASGVPVISQEGRFIAFVSSATNLGPATNGVQQVFVRDTCTSITAGTTCLPRTYLVSTADGSTPANGLSESPQIAEGCASGSSSSTTTCSTTAGPFIAFATQASNLGPNVTPGVENVFVRNTCLAVPVGTACSTNSALVSQPGSVLPEPSNGSSVAPAISSDSHSVGFLSASSNLVSANTGGLEHVYLGATSF